MTATQRGQVRTPARHRELPSGRVISTPPDRPRTPPHRDLAGAATRRLHRRGMRDNTGGAVRAVSGIKQSGLLAYVVRRDESGALRLAPAWPLWALLLPFPVWWALGIGSFIFPILAVPMALALVRRRPLQYPRGWWLWALYLAWIPLSLTMFLQDLPGTHSGSLGGRSLSVFVDVANYAGATAVLLFVGNLSNAELPVRRLMRWLSSLFVVVVAGGLLGTLAPHFSFTSPFEYLLPHGIRSIPYVHQLVHPAAAQVQAVLGDGETGRAAAPFGYTNTWANNALLLLIWFICSWWVYGSPKRRLACAAIVTVAVYPIVYSLNRGLWIGLAMSVAWVAIRMCVQGRVEILLAVVAAAGVGAVIVAASPLGTTFEARLAHPNSNGIRGFLSDQAIKGAIASPVLGWGGTRKTNGSDLSIAVGKTSKCQLCGEFSIGGNGQLWNVMFDRGIVGALFYFGFFLASIWLYRRDRSPPAQAGVLVVALTFIYMFVYNAAPVALTMTMISVGILWRQDNARRACAATTESLQPALAGSAG